MAALKTIVLIAAVFAGTPCSGKAADAQADEVAQWRDLIGAASRAYAVPEPWIASVMRLESGGRETVGGRPITSPKGAMGLMQIMPPTWEDLRDRYGLGTDPYDPRDNIFAGAAYLRELYQRFGYPNLFVAYNAGPGALDAYLGHGAKLPDETQDYLLKLGPEQASIPTVSRRLFIDLGRYGRGSSADEAGRLFIALHPASSSR